MEVSSTHRMGQLPAVHLRGQAKPQPRGSSGPRIRCSSLQTLNRSPVVIRLPGYRLLPFLSFPKGRCGHLHRRGPFFMTAGHYALTIAFEPPRPSLGTETRCPQSVRRSRPSVSTLSRSGPIARIFLKYFCHKGFSGDTLREARSLAGLQPLKSQTPSFLGVSCFTCRILIIEK